MPLLLLLCLLHLVTLNCPVLGHPLCSREAPIPSDLDVDSRSLFNILGGCLATVFACTWVSVHLNVPGPKQGQLALTWRRLGLMLAAVIAPELIAGFAARQFLDALWFSEKYNVSITHGFFFAMGGFVSADGHHPIVTEEQLRLRPEYLVAIRGIRVEDIEDKSKGDLLSKGLAVLQGLWFTIQGPSYGRHHDLLMRVQQHLPLTELEVATLAFQFVNIFIWLLWWCILLGPANELIASAEKSHRPSESYSVVGAAVIALSRNVVALLLGDYYDFDPVTSTSFPLLWSTNGFSTTDPGTGKTRFNVQVIAKVTFVQLPIGTNFDEMLIWRSCALVVAATPLGVTRASNRLFYAHGCKKYGPSVKIPTHEPNGTGPITDRARSAMSLARRTGAAGNLRVAGELIMLWQALGIIARLLRVNGRLRGPVNGFTRTVTVPLEVEPISLTVRGRNRFYGPSFRNFTGRFDALGVTSLFLLCFFGKFFGGELLELYAPHTLWFTVKVIVNIVDNLIIGAYIFARLLLIALSFTTLRALPPSAFVDVN
ncbi:hypothetical protein B0H14DRAFT_2588417 [Mycena olivaceomarginata]|nr:hypothetical protein B0H14DRAFT_2588417 [Mycena olivaceomarginata]